MEGYGTCTIVVVVAGGRVSDGLRKMKGNNWKNESR